MSVAGTAVSRSVAVALMCTAFVACGESEPNAPDGIYLPTLADEADAWPAALITGTLKESNGCIVIDDGGRDDPLLIWAKGTRAERAEDGNLRIVVDDDNVVSTGDHVELGGGLVGEARGEVSHAETLIGSPIPERCRTDGGYWITPGT
jgi:hypothetical protein